MTSETSQADHSNDRSKDGAAGKVGSGRACAILRAGHGHLHAIDLERETGVDNSLIHASVEGRLTGTLYEHFANTSDVSAAGLLTHDFFLAQVVLGVRSARWHVVTMLAFADVVHTVHEIIVEFHSSFLHVAIRCVSVDLDIVAITFHFEVLRSH